jgi:hypothetical protein
VSALVFRPEYESRSADPDAVRQASQLAQGRWPHPLTEQRHHQ